MAASSVEAFAFDNHDLLVRAAWETMSTRDRWLALKAFHRWVALVPLPSLPLPLTDDFWRWRVRLVRFMSNAAIERYLGDAACGEERYVALLDGCDHPDEWVLLDASVAGVDDLMEHSEWREAGVVDFVEDVPPWGASDGPV